MNPFHSHFSTPISNPKRGSKGSPRLTPSERLLSELSALVTGQGRDPKPGMGCVPAPLPVA